MDQNNGSTHFHQQKARLEALLKAKYHCQKCGHNGAYDGSLEVTDSLVVACRPCLGLSSLRSGKDPTSICYQSGCNSPCGPVGIFCPEHAPAPLPSLIKLLPGYKCPECVGALQSLPNGMVGCPYGHVFRKEG